MASLDQEICTNAFIAYCYQEGKYNPQDLLKPFVLKAISGLSKSNFSLSEITNEVKKDCGKKFPSILVSKELSKLLSDEILTFEKEKEIYTVTADLSGIKADYRKALDETTYFLRSLQAFITERSDEFSNISVTKVMNYFEEYCMSNLAEIVKFLGGMYTTKQTNINSSEIERLINAFFEIKIKTDDRLKNEFENIFNGFHLRKIVEICSDKIQSQAYSLNNKIIYLDTNIIIRILGYQSEELNLLGNELLTLLKEYNFEIHVFHDTLEELFYLLRGYSYSYKDLVPGKNISHIYQTLKDKNIEPFEIQEIISNIPDLLREKGIIIDTEDDFFSKYPDVFDEGVKQLAQKKFQKKQDSELEEETDVDLSKYERSAKHDIAAIERIAKLRKGQLVSKFEDTPYYFISADQTLINFNKTYTSSHISESIGDYSISFLLYFYKPNKLKDVSLHSFIAANYSNSQLSISNWINYVKKVSDKYKKHEIDEKQYGYLLTEKILSNESFYESSVDEIITKGLEGYAEFASKTDALEIQNAFMKGELKEADERGQLANKKIENLTRAAQKKTEVISDFSANNKSLETRVSGLENQVKNQETKLSEQDKQFRDFRHFVFIAIAILGILIICFANKIFGSIVSTISFILEILNILDSKLHLNIFVKNKNK